MISLLDVGIVFCPNRRSQVVCIFNQRYAYNRPNDRAFERVRVEKVSLKLRSRDGSVILIAPVCKFSSRFLSFSIQRLNFVNMSLGLIFPLQAQICSRLHEHLNKKNFTEQ